MKSILSVFLGFILNLFLEGFSRIIIAFFYTSEYSFWGVTALPGTFWIVIMYFVSAVTAWFGCMFTMTLAGHSPKKHQLAYLVLIILWSVFEFLSSVQVTPLWYLLSFPATSVLGTFIAGHTYALNQKAAWGEQQK